MHRAFCAFIWVFRVVLDVFLGVSGLLGFFEALSKADRIVELSTCGGAGAEVTSVEIVTRRLLAMMEQGDWDGRRLQAGKLKADYLLEVENAAEAEAIASKVEKVAQTEEELSQGVLYY